MDGVVIAITIGLAAIMILFMHSESIKWNSIVPINIASKLSITAGIVPLIDRRKECYISNIVLLRMADELILELALRP